MTTGIHPDMSEAEYHAHPAASKSTLWRLHQKTPMHAKFGENDLDEKPHVVFGTAAHIAVLEPTKMEKLIFVGGPDRRGNRWKEAEEAADAKGCRATITDAEWDALRHIRDAAHKEDTIRKLATKGGVIEASAFWTDQETGVECRCRPDIYHPRLALMADLKVTGDAGPSAWSKVAGRMGYHLQDHWYSTGWPLAGGGAVDGFLFIAAERKKPYAVALYELTEADMDEARAVAKKALASFAVASKSDVWAGYPTGVTRLSIPNWAYTETRPPQTEPFTDE